MTSRRRGRRGRDGKGTAPAGAPRPESLLAATGGQHLKQGGRSYGLRADATSVHVPNSVSNVSCASAPDGAWRQPRPAAGISVKGKVTVFLVEEEEQFPFHEPEDDE